MCKRILQPKWCITMPSASGELWHYRWLEPMPRNAGVLALASRKLPSDSDLEPGLTAADPRAWLNRCINQLRSKLSSNLRKTDLETGLTWKQLLPLLFLGLANQLCRSWIKSCWWHSLRWQAGMGKGRVATWLSWGGIKDMSIYPIGQWFNQDQLGELIDLFGLLAGAWVTYRQLHSQTISYFGISYVLLC